MTAFLIEEDEYWGLLIESGSKLHHIEHLEDLALTSSPSGTHSILDILHDLHSHLSGKQTGLKISTKYDGSPSIIAGRHPVNGKFFVGTKSVFNKTPKINYSAEDIKKNHGHSPHLSHRLQQALELLPKVIPHRGVFQGDLMYSANDVQEKGKHFEFTPNTITYKVEKSSPMGQLVRRSKLGVVFHTKYDGTDIHDMSASPIENFENFKHDPDVHIIDPKIHGKIDYTPQLQKKLAGHLKKIAELNHEMSMSEKGKGENAYTKIAGQEDSLKRYVNHSVRENRDPSVEGYLVFLKQQEIKGTENLKTDWYKQQKKDHFDTLMQRVVGDADALGSLFKLHKEVQNAKTTVIKALASNSPFEHKINDKKTGPEGFVLNRHGSPIKLVDRAEFSKHNFDLNTKANPSDNPIVFAFGRMNPPTSGHAALVSAVQNAARRKGAGHLVVMSHSHDPDKNPLAPEKKLSYAKKMFPGTNIEVARDDEPTIFHQLRKLEKAGHKHVIVVAGQDRVDEYKKLLRKHNGEQFHFDKIEVHSAGDRNPDKEGVEGMSGKKMRAAATAGDFESFTKGVSKSMNVRDAAKMFRDLRKEMLGQPLIDAKTPGITLARYAKRAKNDALGNKARTEIEKRKRLGLWHEKGGVT